ncbi:uncharacterized protein KIAA0930 homolog isoform X2 [Halichondria panicea]|uniref:uncharacterized protein KIAA0930 homolog isoform X2 n=1 Tax=Halichondria panicea TaxID=6063 RepID=UPI00312B66BC
MDFSHLLAELRKRFYVTNFKAGPGNDERKRTKDPFWVDTFHQLYVENISTDRDDLLFIVKWDDRESRELVEVFRRDATSLPSPRDEAVLWEQTLYLNFILHEFEYHVTCGVVTVHDGVVDSVIRKTEQQVYPSPSQRRMDKKDSTSDVVYPNVMFCVDNFEDVFSHMYSKKAGEKIAVQLIAANKTNIASKLRRLTFKSRNSRVFDLSTPYHFVRMRGPHLKGFAEVAVWKKDVSLSKLKPCTPIVVDTSTSAHFFGTGVASAWSSPSSNSDNSEVHVESSSVPEQDDGNAHKETQGGFSKLKLFWPKKPKQSEKVNTDPISTRMYAYLTYVQLPWYTLLDDILHCTKDMAL